MNNYILPIGASDNAALVGGKAASLARMSKLGLSVPPGVVVTTEAWHEHNKLPQRQALDFTKNLALTVINELDLEVDDGHFGVQGSQYFVSVRSGAPVSMPGMMDTVLNVGATLEWAKELDSLGHGEWSYSVFARFCQMYVKTSIEPGLSEQLDEIFQDHDWYGTPYNLEMCKKADYLLTYGTGFDQVLVLQQCIESVMNSWNSERAVEYRAMHGIPDDLGTAVTVQQMVFGNAPGESATGVLFSRDPNTGENVLWGEWLADAQGEDVVAGLRPALSMADMLAIGAYDLRNSLAGAAIQLEVEYRDMVDIEWTLENGKLWFLQCRPGKRSAEATVKIAVDMANEGLITRTEAIQRAKPVARLLAKQTLVGNPTPIATGDNASYGVASGVVVFSSEKAKQLAPTMPVVLVRRLTDPRDVGGMNVSAAILTQEGGPSSHAAVVARELGVPCVTGANIQLDTIYFEASGKRYVEGDWLTVDGTNGFVYAGKCEFETSNDNPYLATLKEWGL